MSTIMTFALPRIFKFSSLELADPAPELSPEEALRLYAPAYPQLEVAELSDPIVEDDRIVYEVRKHEVKTKG
jgi:PRTRC genetic system protein C